MRGHEDVLVEMNLADHLLEAETSETAEYIMRSLGRFVCGYSYTGHEPQTADIQAVLPEGSILSFRPTERNYLPIERESFRGVSTFTISDKQAIAFTKVDNPNNPLLIPYLPKSSHGRQVLQPQRGEARFDITFNPMQQLVAEFSAPQPTQFLSAAQNVIARIGLGFTDGGEPKFRLGVIVPSQLLD